MINYSSVAATLLKLISHWIKISKLLPMLMVSKAGQDYGYPKKNKI